MSTLFNDGLGRTLSRDVSILPKLAEEYRRSSLMLLAQAGIEIEFLQVEVKRLQTALETCQASQVVPAVKAVKAVPKKD